MNRLAGLAASALLLGLAGGAGAQVLDPAPYNAFVAGVTTKAEARQALGRPIGEAPSLNGHTTLHYEYDDPVHPGARLRIVLLFDPQERLVRYRVYRRDPDPAPAPASAPAPTPVPAD